MCIFIVMGKIYIMWHLCMKCVHTCIINFDFLGLFLPVSFPKDISFVSFFLRFIYEFFFSVGFLCSYFRKYLFTDAKAKENLCFRTFFQIIILLLRMGNTHLFIKLIFQLCFWVQMRVEGWKNFEDWARMEWEDQGMVQL